MFGNDAEKKHFHLKVYGTIIYVQHFTNWEFWFDYTNRFSRKVWLDGFRQFRCW